MMSECASRAECRPGEAGVFERERHDGTQLADDFVSAAMPETGREVGGPNVNVRDRFESAQ